MAERAIVRSAAMVQHRANHAAALDRPMTGAVMVGDPHFIDDDGNLAAREACLYAAAMLRGRDGLPADLSGFDAVFLPPATVVLLHADTSQAEAGRFTIPARVLAFQPYGATPARKALPMPTVPGSAAERVVLVLQTRRFPLSNEKILQAAIADALTAAQLPFEREVRLAAGSVIDFVVEGGVGLEVKIKGQARRIFRQCERYCGSERIQALVLATNRTTGWPAEIAGKPSFVVALGKAWL